MARKYAQVRPAGPAPIIATLSLKWVSKSLTTQPQTLSLTLRYQIVQALSL